MRAHFRYKDVLTYFGAWKPPPTAAPRLAYYQDTLFPELEYEQVKMACEVRGKDTHGLNKTELLNVSLSRSCLRFRLRFLIRLKS